MTVPPEPRVAGRIDRHWLHTVAFTLALVALVTLAMGAEMAHKQEQRARTATATGQPVPGALLDNLAAAVKARRNIKVA